MAVHPPSLPIHLHCASRPAADYTSWGSATDGGWDAGPFSSLPEFPFLRLKVGARAVIRLVAVLVARLEGTRAQQVERTGPSLPRTPAVPVSLLAAAPTSTVEALRARLP